MTQQTRQMQPIAESIFNNEEDVRDEGRQVGLFRRHTNIQKNIYNIVQELRKTKKLWQQG